MRKIVVYSTLNKSAMTHVGLITKTWGPFNGPSPEVDATFDFLYYNFTPPETDPVPEPTTMLLFGMGIAGLAGTRLRRNKK